MLRHSENGGPEQIDEGKKRTYDVFTALRRRAYITRTTEEDGRAVERDRHGVRPGIEDINFDGFLVIEPPDATDSISKIQLEPFEDGLLRRVPIDRMRRHAHQRTKQRTIFLIW